LQWRASELKRKEYSADFLKESKTGYVSPYMIATAYAGLGEKEKAFEYVEKAYQEQSPDIPYSYKPI
jgi:hypothetical protein